ncbi:MAG: MAPEG family protein [Sinobacteraceae bacterium]|nr:MAPEG family protein [Nevskiaceae bacterium]
MTAITALLGFAAWTLLLILMVFAYRGIKLLGGTPITAWPRGQVSPANTPFINRVADAHANCLENLPIFAVLVLCAQALDKTAAVAPLAPYVLYARFGQSLMHLIGVTPLLVLLRASFWSVQLALFVWMFWELLA